MGTLGGAWSINNEGDRTDTPAHAMEMYFRKLIVLLVMARNQPIATGVTAKDQRKTTFIFLQLSLPIAGNATSPAFLASILDLATDASESVRKPQMNQDSRWLQLWTI